MDTTHRVLDQTDMILTLHVHKNSIKASDTANSTTLTF